eukprot:NODE_13551_length_255_cov_12.509709_g12638_i0.p2 GENE.NODE_13551_length_255_cov_12.509709_g12638_i0~~NODE_13551_length_255_cov_12.509709_g12638_i0.p2  ORF type:complete len:55 (+),score=17.44 NODE_13551_length_255_cov_12.509709_g12638_i0:25-165(+)
MGVDKLRLYNLNRPWNAELQRYGKKLNAGYLPRNPPLDLTRPNALR